MITLPSGWTIGAGTEDAKTYRNLVLQVLTNTQRIDEISEVSLPAVTPADNGKVMEVINGEWGASASLLVLSATVDSISDTVLEQSVNIGVLQRQMDNLYDDIIELGGVLESIVEGHVDEEE